MATLTIGKTAHEAKVTFGFDKKLDENLGEHVKGSPKKEGGFHNLYSRLLEFDPHAVADFWDFNLQAQSKKSPTRAAIEEAIEAEIEEYGDVLPLVQEILELIDESGFFKRKVADFFTNVELMKEMGGENEKEARQMEIAVDRIKKARTEIKGETAAE